MYLGAQHSTYNVARVSLLELLKGTLTVKEDVG